MTRELALPKTSPRDVALAILDGIEAGREDIFPDPFAIEFGRQFESSPKASERQFAAMAAAMHRARGVSARLSPRATTSEGRRHER